MQGEKKRGDGGESKDKMQLMAEKMDFSTFVFMIRCLLIFKDSYLSTVLKGEKAKGWSSKRRDFESDEVLVVKNCCL